jgi:hypothetical protein
VHGLRDREVHAGDDDAGDDRLSVMRRGQAPRGLVCVLAGAALAVAAGCGGDGESGEPIPPMLSAIQAQIFTPNCASFSSCHGGGSPQQGMSLVAPAAGAVIGVASSEVPALMRVAPGDPDASYLLQKLERTMPAMGVRMPPDQPLAANKIRAIRMWIAAGAPDD